MSEENKTVELNDDELQKVAGGAIKKYTSYNGLSTSYYYLSKETESHITPVYARIQRIEIDTGNNKKFVYFNMYLYSKNSNTLTLVRSDDRLSLNNFLRQFDTNETLPVDGLFVSIN